MGMQPAARPAEVEMTIWKNFMMIPVTAVGIWAYSGWPKTGSSAPYFTAMFSVAAMDSTMEV